VAPVPRLAALPAEDELEIRALVARYHDTTNCWYPEEWGATWATDAVWHAGARGTVTGRDAIVDLRCTIMAPYRESRLIQLLVQGRVWRAPGGAEGRWTFMEIARWEGHETDHVEIQCNTDRYKREEGRWVFAQRSVKRAYRGALTAGEFFGFPPLD
jgi:hypothetical protein